MRNKPRIRFKGFTEDWEQCKLGDLLILLKDGSHGTHKNTSEGVYLLSAKNIKNGRINIMPDDRIISWDDYNVIHKNYELQSGDILLTIVGSIGETAIYNLKTKVTFQRSVAFLRPNLKLKNGFLYTLMNTDRFQNQLQTKQVVSAQPGIYLRDLASINITYPKNVSEQEKIYNIFKGIEHSITLHQRKLEKLKLAKKALLQKLFPKNGSQFPEIRFKGFTDAWEQYKLEDICLYQSSSVTINDVDENGRYDLYDVNSLIGKTNKGFMEKEYITIIKDGAGVGRTRILPKNSMFLGTMGAITPQNSNLEFLYQLVTSANLGKICSGSTIPHIYFKDYGKLKFYIPSIIEQEVIGKIFYNIDNLITLHQRKLERLQEVKKGLLQKIFV